MIRINDILTELENNIEPLKEQSEKARMFLNLKQDLKQIEVGLFVYNIEKYKKDLENVMQDIDIMNSNYNLEEEKLKQINELKENLKLNVEEIIEKTEKMQNIEFESQQKKEKLNSDINVFKAKIDNNMQNIERIEKENLELNEKIVSSENEIENKINKKNSLKQNKEKFEKELEQKQNELNELTKNFSEKEIKIEEKKKIIIGVVTIVVAITIGLFVAVYGVPGLTKAEYKVDPVLELVQEKVIIHTGDEFDANDYVEKAIDGNGNNVTDLVLTAEIDTEKEGSYDVIYTLSIDGRTAVEKVVKVVITDK